jgi:hypothetical protein
LEIARLGKKSLRLRESGFVRRLGEDHGLGRLRKNGRSRCSHSQ